MLKTYLIPSCLPTVEKNGANTARDFVNKIYLSLFAEKDFFFLYSWNRGIDCNL